MKPDYADGLAALFSSRKNPSLSPAMERYLKGQFQFFGLKSTPRREAFREYVSQHGLPGKTDWKTIVFRCWDMPQREMQYAGMELAFRCRKHWTAEDIGVIEYLVVHKSWWDTVDYIASTLVGHYMKQFPDRRDSVTGRWKVSDNFWLVRTSLLFQLKYKSETDFDLLTDIICRHLGSKEFFINKAIGWALRQYAYSDPEAVITFVENTALSPLSRREALKNM